MRSCAMRQLSGKAGLVCAGCALLAAVLLPGGAKAQDAVPIPQVQPARQSAPAQDLQRPKLAPPRRRTHFVAPQSALVQDAATAAADPSAVVPVQPEPPKWPVLERARPASIVWDSQGLRIEAANSSLEQILHEVGTLTGTQISGMSKDQRVFGVYGPGQARDVLSEVLQGAGYNVLMIGDQGMGAPRQLVLSVRKAATKPGQPAEADADAGGDDDSQAAEEDPDPAVDEQPQQPMPQPAFRPGFGPTGQPSTPQQIMQEMQMRQQRLQDLQQQPPQQPQ